MSYVVEKERLYTEGLFRSLRESQLLVGDLPEAASWGVVLSGDLDGAVLNFDQKLGHLYEDALEVLIRRSVRFELLAKNLQVFDAAGQTLGEMDFVIRDGKSGECFQLELAVKFYLSVLMPDGSETYPGPDPRDNWNNKLERMRSRQLQLSKREEAQVLLKERFGIESLSVRQRIYGVIFDSISADRESAPPFVGAGCRRAKWLYVDAFKERYETIAELRIVPKYLWPVSLDDALRATLELVSVDTLIRQSKERCVMFWDEQSQDVVFLVPDTWPNFD